MTPQKAIPGISRPAGAFQNLRHSSDASETSNAPESTLGGLRGQRREPRPPRRPFGSLHVSRGAARLDLKLTRAQCALLSGTYSPPWTVYERTPAGREERRERLSAMPIDVQVKLALAVSAGRNVRHPPLAGGNSDRSARA